MGVGAAWFILSKWLNEQNNPDVILGKETGTINFRGSKNVAGNLYVATDDGTYG